MKHGEFGVLNLRAQARTALRTGDTELLPAFRELQLSQDFQVLIHLLRCRSIARSKYAFAGRASAAGLNPIHADVCRGAELGMGAGDGCNGQQAGLECWMCCSGSSSS